MTLVKLNNRPVHRTFNALFNDLFDQFPAPASEALHVPPTNVYEASDSYLMEISAPGLNKEDFSIAVENSLLTIGFEKKEDKKSDDTKTLRREFSYRSFKRSFSLDEEVDVENIQAKYENGILKLTLPKKEPAKNSTKQISIR